MTLERPRIALDYLDILVWQIGGRELVERDAMCLHPAHPEVRPLEFKQFKVSDRFLAAARRATRLVGRAAAIDRMIPDGWVPVFCPHCDSLDLRGAVISPAPSAITPTLALERRYLEDERAALTEA